MQNLKNWETLKNYCSYKHKKISLKILHFFVRSHSNVASPETSRMSLLLLKLLNKLLSHTSSRRNKISRYIQYMVLIMELANCEICYYCDQNAINTCEKCHLVGFCSDLNHQSWHQNSNSCLPFKVRKKLM